MIEIKIEKAHTMGRQKAKQAVVKAFADDPLNHDIKDKWDGFKCDIKGEGVEGNIVVDDKRVRLDLKISILIRQLGVSSADVEADIRRRLDAALN